MSVVLVFFFNDTATTEIYTLSLHDALPIFAAHEEQEPELLLQRLDLLAERRLRDVEPRRRAPEMQLVRDAQEIAQVPQLDRKSTRLNSSHANISYAVFCLKKKKIARPICNL